MYNDIDEFDYVFNEYDDINVIFCRNICYIMGMLMVVRLSVDMRWFGRLWISWVRVVREDISVVD
jgi:hypothetical protein